MKATRILTASAAVLCALTVSSAHADTFGTGLNTFTIDFVDIGNAGNAADSTTYGAVPYAYRMGVTEVSQDWLTKAGTPGGGFWTGNQPAADITWYQAAAFVDYLNTSTGHVAAYNLDPTATSLTLWSSAQAWQLGGENLYRNKDAYYFLPSEDEWYKAAYYDPSATGYNLYPTGNSIPTPVASGTTAGTAVYDGVTLSPAAVNNDGGLSPYGTRGQGGNVWEWQESAYEGSNDSSSVYRALRGGSSGGFENFLRSSYRIGNYPTSSGEGVGFRVASVPEPSSTVLMIGSGLMLLARRRRERSL